MSTQKHYERLHAIFQRARAVPREEADRVLDEECGGDDSLRLEVLELLQQAERENDPLSDDALEDGRQFEGVAPGEPEVIGGCRVIRQLGAGGMGVVYEAEQLTPHRRVAIKVLGRIASASVVRRFQRESEALAMLKHPGVAQIYDVGVDTTTGRETPYIVMELIDGLPLNKHAAQHSLGLADRLRLIAEVCSAVEHAHQRGVIHRDLKPDNILVEASGQPRVLDFGIARITQADTLATQETEVGQIVGTIAYMSPEQAAGDPSEIDTRSDVYSLGAVLYELLSGELPHGTGASLLELLSAIREKTPARLSAVNPQLRGDIETIVAKALDKEKDRRYQSAGELGEDIRRYLDDRPIAAHPPSALYQIKKYAKRNRLVVTSVAAIFVSLLVGLGATGVALSRESQQRERAEAELVRASAAVGFLESTLLSVSPTETEGLDTELMRTILDRSAGNVEHELGDQPELQAQMLSLIGQAYGKISEFGLSAEYLRRAIDIYGELHGEAFPPRMRTVYALGGTHRMAGDLEAAAELLDGSLVVFETNPDDRAGHADHLLERGSIAILLGDFDGSLVFADRALALFAEDESTLDVARARMLRGNSLRRIDRLDEARDEYLLIREIYVSNDIVNTIEYADLMNSMAIVLRRMGDDASAEITYKEALATRLALDPRPDPGIAAILNNLGRTLVNQRKTDEAVGVIRQSVAMHRELFDSQHFGTAISIATLAQVLAQQGEIDESLELFDEALPAMTSVLGPEHPHIVTLYIDKCVVLNHAERYEEALPFLERALEITERQQLGDRTYKSPLLACLGNSLRGLGRLEEAKAHEREALSYLPPDVPRAVQLRERLASPDPLPPAG